MAEFVQTMKDWKRMCDTYTTDDAVSCCNGCPMSGRGCGSIYESGNAEPDIIEREVMSWAAEHPEPKTPKWFDYLCNIGVFNDCKTAPEVLAALTELHIPPAIAERLGLLPE